MIESEYTSTFDAAALFGQRPLRARGRLVMRRIRSVIGNDPAFLPVVLRATPRGTSRRITAATDIVVEGYPRSGNTFAAAALRYIGGPDLTIASHVHTPSQVVLAVRRKVPVLLAIRQPIDCIASMIIAAPHVPIDLALREWTDHYGRLWTHREHLVIATFDQITQDFGSVIDRVNRRFAMRIPSFSGDEECRAGVQALMTADHERFHDNDERNAPWPTASRDEARRALLSELSRASLRHPGQRCERHVCPLRRRCLFVASRLTSRGRLGIGGLDLDGLSPAVRAVRQPPEWHQRGNERKRHEGQFVGPPAIASEPQRKGV